MVVPTKVIVDLINLVILDDVGDRHLAVVNGRTYIVTKGWLTAMCTAIRDDKRLIIRALLGTLPAPEKYDVSSCPTSKVTPGR